MKIEEDKQKEETEETMGKGGGFLQEEELLDIRIKQQQPQPHPHRSNNLLNIRLVFLAFDIAILFFFYVLCTIHN